MASGQTAGTLGCARCGGRFEALPNAPAAYCPYCGHQQPVSPELGGALQRYQVEVARETHRAADAYRQAAAWQHLAEQHAPARHGAVYLPIALGSFGTLIFVLGAVFAFQPAIWRATVTELARPVSAPWSIG